MREHERDAFWNACFGPDHGAPQATVLINSDADSQALAAHLGQMQLARSTGAKQAWLRVHDPRVWLQLNRVLRAEQLNALLGPITRWTFCCDGQWLTQEKTGQQGMLTRMDAATWPGLERIGIVNRVLAQMARAERTVNEVMHISRDVDQLAQRAIQVHQLAHLDDQVAFCLLGLRVHQRFDAHPSVLAYLTQARHDSAALDELLAQDDAFWHSVSQSLNTLKEPRT